MSCFFQSIHLGMWIWKAPLWREGSEVDRVVDYWCEAFEAFAPVCSIYGPGTRT